MIATETRIPLSALRRNTAALADPVLTDRLGRPLRDLRISVTDRCNFRCSYCMPRDKFGREHAFLSHTEILRYEEITRLAKVFAGLGVEKIRLTGGEPLMRKHLDRLVSMLAEIPGLDLTLTTNGALLARHAATLKAAGLRRVTVSLDALDDAVFRRMSDAGCGVNEVLAGIDAAAAAGLGPIKINMVVRRGVNDQEILPLARRFRHSGHILRFIEYMDVGSSNGWRMDDVVPAREILARIAAEHPLEALDRDTPGEVAERWRYADGAGEIGVIASVTQAFCKDCTRLRLSPEGKLFTCLFASQGHDLRALLREERDDAALAGWISSVWRERGDRYSELRGTAQAPTQKIEMSYIGG
ncbi:GTP 3',8-cyclase MoaA [Uliginosibacterium sp. 31-16]|uniref:GTP 3',8-cyclase MoaA n=1 Tax=Uliginosibacterium sp. 31-16 TaxID=3068315 RepID=UPI00273EC4BA|nr:GTP 3',8-cyclase MoaA [Uliginosibacterium sp. 31-16]MDP5238072.1 GTP 3',8-cyclase MoaA [Uliginosibacterium sp. 31-16]